MRALWTLLLAAWAWIAGAGIVAAVEADRPQTPAVAEAQVKALAEKLASDDHDAREKAEADLLALGEPAWEYLEPYLKDERDEVARRTSRLADKIAAVPVRDSAKAQEFIDLLYDKDDEFKRARGIDGLLSLGRGGIRLASQKLSGAGTRLDVSLNGESHLVEPGKKMEFTAKALNVGTGLCWMHQSDTFQIYEASWMPLGENREHEFGTRSVGGRRRVTATGYYNPIRAWHACMPDTTITSAKTSFEFKVIGTTTICARFRLNQSKISPRLPGEETTVDFQMNSALTPEDAGRSSSYSVFALPNPEKTSDSQLSLEVARAKGECAVSTEGRLPITLTLRSKDDKALQIEQNMLRWAWYCWIDEKENRVVRHASLASALPCVIEPDEEKTRKELATFALAPKGSSERTLHIPTPQTPGTFRLVVGYEVTSEFLDITPMEPMIEDALMYTDGLLATQLKGIVVEPAKASKSAETDGPAK